MKELNIALLGKWCWRCLVDKEGLSYKVLSSRYGEERGQIKDGGTDRFAWYREIVKVCEGIGVDGGKWNRKEKINFDL